MTKSLQILHNIHIVLVEPENPGNIGSAARAMKTCGLSQMTLVRPRCDLDHEDVRKMAHRSRDIVKNARLEEDLATVLNDMHFSVGTTMRKRHTNFPYYSPQEISDKIFSMGEDRKTALVFGNERNGLSNDDLELCMVRSTIATATQNPALNLAQSIMIYCHTLYSNALENKGSYGWESANSQQLETVYARLRQALESRGFEPNDGMDAFITRFKRILGRAQPEERDVMLMHKILQVLEREKDKM